MKMYGSVPHICTPKLVGYFFIYIRSPEFPLNQEAVRPQKMVDVLPILEYYMTLFILFGFCIGLNGDQVR
jgi:hypothetical protein